MDKQPADHQNQEPKKVDLSQLPPPPLEVIGDHTEPQATVALSGLTKSIKGAANNLRTGRTRRAHQKDPRRHAIDQAMLDNTLPPGGTINLSRKETKRAVRTSRQVEKILADRHLAHDLKDTFHPDEQHDPKTKEPLTRGEYYQRVRAGTAGVSNKDKGAILKGIRKINKLEQRAHDRQHAIISEPYVPEPEEKKLEADPKQLAPLLEHAVFRLQVDGLDSGPVQSRGAEDRVENFFATEYDNDPIFDKITSDIHEFEEAQKLGVCEVMTVKKTNVDFKEVNPNAPDDLANQKSVIISYGTFAPDLKVSEPPKYVSAIAGYEVVVPRSIAEKIAYAVFDPEEPEAPKIMEVALGVLAQQTPEIAEYTAPPYRAFQHVNGGQRRIALANAGHYESINDITVREVQKS